MVINRSQHTRRPPVPQGSGKPYPEPNKIAANTPFDFSGKNLTPYGGLLPVATMLEKLGFRKLVEETLSISRMPRAMTIYQFLLGMVLALYVGFSRLNHLRQRPWSRPRTSVLAKVLLHRGSQIQARSQNVPRALRSSGVAS